MGNENVIMNKVYTSILVIILAFGTFNLSTYGQTTKTIGGTGADYATLKSAFDAINAGSITGEIILQITGNTTETANATLNASGSGNANYTSVTIYPTQTGITISGNLASPLVDLDGANNVTIDGRLNASGTTKDLSIVNSNVSTAANTSTIRFQSSAVNNTIQYCTIKGGATGGYSGVILFARPSTGNGNSNNRIEHCDLAGLGASNRPFAVVYSFGNPGRENSNNSISNNNIYDFLRANASSSGIYIYQYSSDWIIEGNSFYETANFVPTGNSYYYAVRIYNEAGNNFSITNNYIGGKAALCGGSPLNMNSSTSYRFFAIHLDVGTLTPTSVQGNIIQNFDITSSYSIPWMGIDVNSGAANIGTVSGNIIGSATGNNSVLLTNTIVSNSSSYGIYVNSSGTVVISNNTIGSVTTMSSSLSSTHSFFGIYKVGNKSGSLVISHNLVGSLTTSNSIQAVNSSTSASAQNVYGINSSATGTTEISSNTVANLFNAYDYDWANGGQVVGIYTNNGINTIQNNTVRDLVCTSPSSANVGSAAVIGIAQQSTLGGQSISGNEIYDLSSSYTRNQQGVTVMGIFYIGGTSGTNTITENFVHSLSAVTTYASLTGIKVYTGTTTIANNIINLGVGVSTGLKIYGFYENGNLGNDNSIWFNSVYIGGTANNGTIASTYALYSATNNNGRDFRNNILYNARTGDSGGNHYSIRINGTSNLIIDYNDYFVSGSPSQLGQSGGTNYADFDAWKAKTLQDLNSENINPSYATAGGTVYTDYCASAALPGVSGTGITTDYAGLTRPSTPKMGALESNNYVWVGGTSTDFGTAANWSGGVVPPAGANITFAASPSNDCVLDQNRTVGTITNAQSTHKLVTNGHQLTITKNLSLSNGAQIDASSTSTVVIFAGTSAQSIPSGAFVNNTVDGLTLNNSEGLTLNGNLTVAQTLTLTSGDFSIGANSLTLNGAISVSSGTLTGSASSNLSFGGSGASTNLPAITLNNLTINRSNGIVMTGALSVGGTLALSSGTLTLGANTLTISGSSPTSGGGAIDASNSSASLVFTNTSAITLPSAFFSTAVNNLSVNGAGGITAGGNFSVNGTLNLQSANPSATKGCLDMGANTLSMGSSSTTTGLGDVTGIVKREHTFNVNTPYTFGSQFTTISFSDSDTKPTWIKLKITIGNEPGWDPWDPTPNGIVSRYFDIACSNNSSTSQAVVNMRYLVSELDATYNDEHELIFWHKLTGYNSGLPHEHGKSNQNFDDHYIGVTGIILGSAATETLGDSEIAMAYSLTEKNEWKGEVSGYETEWTQPGNWTDGTVPVLTDDVLIPSGKTYYPSLTSNVTAHSIEIESGASISANDYDITITGFEGAWINNGDFYPGTGKVIFDHDDLAEIVTISGTTNFYDIEAGASTTMQPVAGCVLRIAGAGTADGTSVIDFSTINNTVEYNGTNQTIVNPSGLSGNSGYYNLKLSGSGTKTMPATAMDIRGNLTVSGTASATAAAAISIDGNLSIEEGATFGTGTYSHAVKGNLICSGTITPASGSLFTMNGSTVQSIEGEATSINLGNLTISNTAGVNLFTPAVTANLNIASGVFTVISGVSLTTTGTATLNSVECLVLESDADGTASFIDNGTISGTGTAIIERYLSPYDEVSDQKFHFISSPVGSSQAIEPEFIDISSFDITDFFKWDEPTNYWINFRGSSFNTRNEEFGDDFKFVAGKGYLVSYPSPGETKNFTGAPYTSTSGLSINCTNTSGGGWNLIGNPFPSSIDWTSASGITKTDVDAALYYYDNATPGYKYYVNLTGGLGTATKYIAPMQGFMVHASAESGSVTIKNAARTHDGQNVFYKNEQLTTNILDLKVEGNNRTDYTRICFYDQASENFDGDFDAYKLFSYNEATSELYSKTPDNTSLAINTQPLATMEGGSVPISFKVGIAGNYTLSAEKLNSFSPDTYITLEDKGTGAFQKLNDNPVYVFSASSQDEADRFLLHFKDAASIPESGISETIRVWFNSGKLFVNSNEGTTILSIFNVQGQNLLNYTLYGSGQKSIALKLPAGVYFARLINDNKMQTVKIIIQ